VRVTTNLDDLSGPQAAHVLAQLAYQLDVLPDLEKASRWKVRPMDPAHPELTTLLRLAEADWTRWGQQLIDEVAATAGNGWALDDPLAAERLAEVFRQHKVRILVRWSGNADLVPKVPLAGRWGTSLNASYIEVAWRLGRAWQPWVGPANAPKPAPRAGTFADLVTQAMELRLSEPEKQALAYAKTRAGIYMRRPLMLQQQAAHRGLMQPELQAMQRAISEGVLKRLPRQARKDAIRRELVGHPSLTNELDRVQRTEMAFAHNDGAAVALQAKAKSVGIKDPLVWKLVRGDACDDCKRIWGVGAKPRKYRMSEVRANDAAGGNFGRPRKAWVAVSGPIHPNCTEGPLQLFHPVIFRALMATVPEAFEAG
jgi:hypothetical protein